MAGQRPRKISAGQCVDDLITDIGGIYQLADCCISVAALASDGRMLHKGAYKIGAGNIDNRIHQPGSRRDSLLGLVYPDKQSLTALLLGFGEERTAVCQQEGCLFLRLPAQLPSALAEVKQYPGLHQARLRLRLAITAHLVERPALHEKAARSLVLVFDLLSRNITAIWRIHCLVDGPVDAVAQPVIERGGCFHIVFGAEIAPGLLIMLTGLAIHAERLVVPATVELDLKPLGMSCPIQLFPVLLPELAGALVVGQSRLVIVREGIILS